jgi:hypothetical protein
MTQVIQQGQSGGNAVAVKRVDLTYNAAGQFDVISRFQSTTAAAPVATSHYGYDGMGRLTDLDHKTGGGGPVARLSCAPSGRDCDDFRVRQSRRLSRH